LSEGARQLHATTVDDGDLVSVGDQVSDGLSGRVEDFFVLKGGTA
jgi:hypothetical protein